MHGCLKTRRENAKLHFERGRGRERERDRERGGGGENTILL